MVALGLGLGLGQMVALGPPPPQSQVPPTISPLEPAASSLSFKVRNAARIIMVSETEAIAEVVLQLLLSTQSRPGDPAEPSDVAFANAPPLDFATVSKLLSRRLCPPYEATVIALIARLILTAGPEFWRSALRLSISPAAASQMSMDGWRNLCALIACWALGSF